MTTITIEEATHQVTVLNGAVSVTPVEQTTAVTVSAGGVTAHGDLTGLDDANAHPQYLAKAQNLADLPSAETARTNLGLVERTAEELLTYIGALGIANNLSDVADAATARANLGLVEKTPAEILAEIGALPLAGGTMTGALVLAGAPTIDLHAATKLYVDTEVASAGGGASDVGDLTTTGLTAANMLRVAAAGGLEEQTPAQVLANIAALPLAGGTMTGALTVTGSSIAPTNLFEVTNNQAGQAQLATVAFMAPNLPNAGNTGFHFGKAASSRNRATLRYTHVGDGSTSNYISLDFFGANGLLNILANGRVGVGAIAPEAKLHVAAIGGSSSVITEALRLGNNPVAAGAAGGGTSVQFHIKSSTTDSQVAGRIAAVWTEATHATRKADLVLSAFDTAEREGLRIRATGSAALLITSLPTSDPSVAGALWSNGGVVTVSAA